MPKYLPYIILLWLTFSCHPDKTDLISVTPQRAAFAFSGGEGVVSVTSTINWSAAIDTDWAIIDSTTKTNIYYHLTVNHTRSSRMAMLTITGERESHQVLIEQQAPPSGNPDRAFDSLALVTLAKQCDGENWYLGHDSIPHPWEFGRPINQWDGVGTTTIDGQLRVITLDLSGVGVKGELPSELADLTAIELLMLRQNEITGNAISLCAQIPSLSSLDLARNQSINYADTPPAGSFANLRYLDLSVCPINGEIPQWVMLPGLIELSMSSCSLTGEIPQQMASMTNLSKLDLSDNQLSGEIPSWISSLGELIYLDLSTCQLTGRIPANIGNLTSMQTLKLAGNQLQGEIPQSIGRMSYLSTLNLSDNQLTTLPDQIAQLSKLKYIDVSFNNIEGGLIEEWASLKDLSTLTLVGNRMTGVIPEQVLSDKRWKSEWFGPSLIIPQQEGYGFSN